MIHKSHLNFLERNEVKKFRINEQEKEAKILILKNESVANNKPYDLREKKILITIKNICQKKQCRYIISSLGSQTLYLLSIDNSFSKEENEDKDENEDDIIIINNVDEFCFKNGNPKNDLKIRDNNMFQLF
ncbi:hypothetical protein RhiirA4_470388 [Rhizophagus irregularis]|uniref:Uncharacterized protein n=1 Tax=Rhizophagus irregularis TaxID=588596 RepID=A0A2I1H159_9GLOM|nr:hypothetical protein RhiirA4_470388 [Rhizophagus irregularis]